MTLTGLCIRYCRYLDGKATWRIAAKPEEIWCHAMKAREISEMTARIIVEGAHLVSDLQTMSMGTKSSEEVLCHLQTSTLQEESHGCEKASLEVRI
jgi:hypothetical protein